MFYFPSNFISLSSLGGPRSAFNSAIACGILLGVFEGVGVLLSRVFSEGQRPQMAPCTSCRFSEVLLLMKSFCSTLPRRPTGPINTSHSWTTIDVDLYTSLCLFSVNLFQSIHPSRYIILRASPSATAYRALVNDHPTSQLSLPLHFVLCHPWIRIDFEGHDRGTESGTGIRDLH